MSEPIAVDVTVELTTIVIDAVALDPVEAIDVTVPPGAPVVIDVITLDPTEAVDVTLPEAGPILVEPIVILGGPPGPAGAGAEVSSVQTFGSASPITPGTVAFIGVGWSVTEEKAHFQVLQDGIVTDFGVSIGVPLEAGTIVVTLRKNGFDTAHVVTLSGSDQAEYVTGSVVFVKGDMASIRAVVDVDVPANVIVTATWRMVAT